MTESALLNVECFYNTIASDYTEIENDWDSWLIFNQNILEKLIALYCPGASTALDCAAGVGSQAVALESLGLDVTASDISSSAILELSKYSDMPTLVSSWQDLPKNMKGDKFDMVFCLDNAIGHTESKAALIESISIMLNLLSDSKHASVFISTRDFDALQNSYPKSFPEKITKETKYYQKWDWINESAYCATWFINGKKVAATNMRCIYRAELIDMAEFLNVNIEECMDIYTQPVYRIFRK